VPLQFASKPLLPNKDFDGTNREIIDCQSLNCNSECIPRLAAGGTAGLDRPVKSFFSHDPFGIGDKSIIMGSFHFID
jgi:hypothetical protein